MQDLCAKVCELRSLFKVEVAYRRCLVHHARVVVVHTVYVGPDLDFFCIYGCANQGCGIVRTAPLEVVNLVLYVGADEALGDVQVRVVVLLEDGGESGADVVLVRLSVYVQFHKLKGGEQDGVDTCLLQVAGHHIG